MPTIVAKREGILDLEQYASASAEDLFSDDEADERADEPAPGRRPEPAPGARPVS